MNITTLANNGFSARFFAGITMLSLLLSAFPVAFFVAQAAVSTTIFTDSFETEPAFSAPVWTNDPKWSTNASQANTGDRKAKTEGNTNGAAVLETVIDATGYESLAVSFFYKQEGFEGSDDNDRVVVEWFDGLVWTELTTFTGEAGDADDVTVWTQWTGSLGSAADNNSAIKLRFTSFLDAGNDKFFLDDVTLSGSEIEEEVVEKEEVFVTVTGDTVTSLTSGGWLFNRDVNNATPIEFNDKESVIGDGSLEVLPISNTEGPRKFIGEYFPVGGFMPVADFESFSYDFKIGAGGASSDAGQFYLNIYTNLTNPAGFYDCRYDYVPSSGSTGSFTTFEALASADADVVANRNAAVCPDSIGDLPDGSTIRAFTLNLGDTVLGDADLDGYFDNVVLETATTVTTFDFEPAPVVIPGCTNELAANYDSEATVDDESCVLLPVSQCLDNAPNLLTNGSFEVPPVTNTSKWQKFNSAATGWTTTKVSDATPTTLELMRGIFGNSAADGDQYAELDGDHSTKVSQTAATQARAKYELSWAFAGRHNAGGDIQNQMDILVNGSSVATTGPQTDPAGLASYDCTRNSYVFTASSNATEIAFADLGPSNTLGTYLDDARLCLVAEPEPAPTVCSFAGEVVAITENPLKFDGSPVDTDRRTLTSLDSVAPYINFFGKEGNAWSTSDFLSLGVEGSVTYKFTGKVAIDGPGDDIAIWEVTGGATNQQTNAKAIVEVSQNGTDFYNLGTITGDGAVDIAPSGYTYVQYVRVTDDSRSIGNDDGGDGYDIDAITIIDGSCDDYVTVNTSKIVCDYEEELPNWGAGSANITAATAAVWLAENDDTSCRLVDGWEFEWAKSSAANPGNNYVGYGGSNWNTFTAQTAVPLSLVDGKSFWMREVLQDGYIGFGGANKKADISAEMYCHKDVLNYDNFDRVDSPKAGGEYYCVAWNVPEAPPQCELDIYSDTTTVVLDTNSPAVATYDNNPRWTASIPGAIWVWITEQVTDPEVDEIVTFIETFTVENPTLGNITIAYDNWLTLDVNGTEFVRNQNGYQDFQKFEQDILSALVSGENRIEMTVTNLGTDRSNYRSNPAGTLFHIEVEGDPKSCGRTTEPEQEMYLIDGYKYEGEYRYNDSVRVANPSLPDWTIELYDEEGTLVMSTTTDEQGYYYFWVEEGEFEVREVMKSGWEQVGVDDGGDYVYPDDGPYSCSVEFPLVEDDYPVFNSIALVRNDIEYNYSDYRCDFYNERRLDPLVTIYGYKFESLGDEEVPQGLDGWTINLEDGEGNVLYTTTTDSDGRYEFNVPAGEYYEVYEVMQSGWSQVSVFEGETEKFPSEGDAFCGFDTQVPEYIDYTGDQLQSRVVAEQYRCEFYNEYSAPEVPEVITTRSSSGGSATRIRQALPTPLVLGETTTNFCPFLVDYMQMGVENDPLEVMKLQMFLNIFRNLFGGTENPVTGTFGAITDANVKAFQEAYRSEILDPWYNLGIVPHNRPTGFVYKTTLWKINSIVCPETAVMPEFAGESLTTNVAIDAAPIED